MDYHGGMVRRLVEKPFVELNEILGRPETRVDNTEWMSQR